MTTEPSGAAVNFNIDKYKIKGENQNFTIKIKDDQFDVTVKPMTWKSKNDLVAKCMTFEPTGASSFDSGKYVKEVLKYIIVDAPWGNTTDEFLDSINSELGAALEQLVPSAMDTNLSDVDVIKKDRSIPERGKSVNARIDLVHALCDFVDAAEIRT